MQLLPRDSDPEFTQYILKQYKLQIILHNCFIDVLIFSKYNLDYKTNTSIIPAYILE